METFPKIKNKNFKIKGVDQVSGIIFSYYVYYDISEEKKLKRYVLITKL